MDAEPLNDRSLSLTDAENWLALGAGALLLLVGASRRSTVAECLAVSSAPLLYLGITGRWPDVLNGYVQPAITRSALGGDRGVHVRESIRLEVPVREKYDACIKVVMKPGAATLHHTYPPWSRQQ